MSALLRATLRRAFSPPLPVWVAAGVATVLALVSAWDAAQPTWHRLNADYRTYAAYSDSDRAKAASNAAGFAGDLFGFFSSSLEAGDRVYYQVPKSPYGTLDLHDTVAALGRFYLPAAVQVTDLDDATVVISYRADPRRLGRRFLSQRQNGPDISVSRLAFP